jgi:hypothetical protein
MQKFQILPLTIRTLFSYIQYKGVKMDNIADLIQMFSNKQEEKKIEIPKELADQYPYGQFPIRYTKIGQEEIRKQSENRFSYSEEKKEQPSQSNNLDMKSLLPIIQLMSSGKKNPNDMMKILSKLLFKDNPERRSCTFRCLRWIYSGS